MFLNIIPAPQKARKTSLIGVLALLAIATAVASEEVPASRSQAETEALFDAYAAKGRRVNPSEQQIEWRRQAGEVELVQWPGELELDAIRPTLDRFFASLQGRGFVDRQVQSLFTEDFLGTRLIEAESGQQESGVLNLSRWQASKQPSVDRSTFAENWSQRFLRYSHIARTEYFVDHVERVGSANVRRLAIPFRVTGTREAYGYEDQGEMLVDVRRDEAGNHWQIARVELKSMETIKSPALFAAQPLMPERAPLDLPLDAYVDYFAQGVSVVDFDSDGDLDIFAPTEVAMPKLYRNDGHRNFTEVGEVTGFGEIRAARSGYFFDWDNDGDRDALVLTAQRMHLLEFRDGAFHDVSSASRFDRMSTTGLTSATVADFNGDGFLEFYVANYGDLSRSPIMDYFDSERGFQNQLFRNAGDGTFRMVTREAGLDADNARWSFAAMSFDYDDDGDQDLYVVNDYGPNQLYANRGDMSFTDVTAEAGVADLGNGMGVSLGDLNGDGREDVYVSNMISHAGIRMAHSENFPGDELARARLLRFAKGNTLLVSREGRFEEVGTRVLSDAKWAWGNVLFDYDNDADLDVYVTNGMYSNLRRSDTDPVFWRHLLAPISAGSRPGSYASAYFNYLIQQESHSFAGFERNRLFHNFGAGEFRDVAATTGADLVHDGRSVVAADLDVDGDLDLVVANRNQPKLIVLWNELAQPGHYIEVELRGSISNRDGVGAQVELQCGEFFQRRTVQAGSGYLSQGPLALWFGLGDCARLDWLKVRWPSGKISLVDDVQADKSLRVVEN